MNDNLYSHTLTNDIYITFYTAGRKNITKQLLLDIVIYCSYLVLIRRIGPPHFNDTSLLQTLLITDIVNYRHCQY